MEKGFCSLEEQMQMYTDIFFLLQQEKGEQVKESFNKSRSELKKREQMTQIFLPSEYLQECCNLTELEYWLMMFAFCCELEEGLCLDYRNKFNENLPSLQYALHLLSPVIPVNFSDVAQLCRKKGVPGDILELEYGKEIVLKSPLLLKPLVFHFLLTGELIREEWYSVYMAADRESEETAGCFLPLHEKECGKLCSFFNMETPLRILLHGSKGSGRHTLLRRSCQKIQTDIFFVKTEHLWQETEENWQQLRAELRLVVRLLKPVVVLEFTEEPSAYSFRENEWKSRMALLLSSDFKDCHLCFLTQSQELKNQIKEFADVKLVLTEMLSMEEKRIILDAWLKPEERQDWQEELLERYRFNVGEMISRKKTIRLLAQAENVSLSSRKVWLLGLREKQDASGLGRIVEEQYGLEDIILSERCKNQLETIIGLAKVWHGERGMKLLFHGSPGTGKTMAASVLAGQLQLPLFKVDLSQIFDKYIGETEKHINEIFSMAWRNQYLLFFDEADALFGKRTTVKDSHDKYANVSASYLLTRMEEHQGILILATNLKDNFDDAFARRIHFMVKFNNLDCEGRIRLWKKVLEGTPPADDSVDYKALAQAAQWSPARISSVAYVAKLLAVYDKSTTITEEHLRKAVMLEAEKDETTVKSF